MTDRQIIVGRITGVHGVKGWVTLPRKRFEQQLGPLMMEFHQAAKRNDLKRGNTAKRGFMHVEIIETDTTTSEP